MYIGGSHYHVDDLGKFTDYEIAGMNVNALEFWLENKHKLIVIANLTKE